ncbi:MAG: YidB family protein [Burkholderiales bacterium]
MSLMDSLLGSLGGALGGQAPQGNPMLQAAMALLAGGQQGGAGGLADLVSAFTKGGLGDVVQSWIGTGQNLPISPEQLQQVLGGDTVAGLARQLGLSPQDASQGLAGLLPQLVDQLTPQGQLPQNGLGDIASIMEKLGGRRG